jgi:hypothetical protein
MSDTSRWKAVGLLLLAGLLGGAAGSAITVSVMGGGHGPGGHRRGSDWYVELLQRELTLTASQRDSVEAVLDRYSAPMEQIWTDMESRIDSLRSAIRQDIRAQLSAEQQARYTEVTARLDAERRSHRKR